MTSMPAQVGGPFHVALEEDEWRFVRKLREVPPSPLRDRGALLIDAVLDFLASPGCPESQADGVPCDTVHMSCERCQEVLSLLDGLRRQVGAF